MKFCQAHYDELKQEIKDSGMWHLVAPNCEEAARRAHEWNEKRGDDATNFEPLVGAVIHITASALDAGGDYLTRPDENGNMYCPVCEAHKYSEINWIKETVELAVGRAKELGILKVN